MEPLLFLPLAISFLVTYVLTPYWINAAHRIKLTGKDMNKYVKPEVAEMGGITVIAGFLSGVLLYIALITFYFRQETNLIYILATISTVLVILTIGILDDLLEWKIGLKKWQKPLLTTAAALPMMVVNAGQTAINLPFFGNLDFGILYPLLIIPMGITGAANGFNMLAGYNGLEAGMGVVILAAMGIIAWQVNLGWVGIIAFCMAFALLAFLKYNWYPAKIFPGDSLTYSVGAAIACIAILANEEKIALLLFIPYFSDFLLPLRSKFKTEAFAKANEDNSLEMPYEKDYRGIYDTTHLALFLLKKIKSKVYESNVVTFVLLMEIFLAFIALLWVR